MRVSCLILLFCCLGLSLAAGTALAQPAVSSQPSSGATQPPAPWLDVGVHPGLSTRSLTVEGDSGRLDYRAPMQAGLAVRASVYPGAIALPSQAWLSPLGLHADVSRHYLLSVVEVRAAGRVYEVDVPTRFATSRFGVHYRVELGSLFELTPSLGLQQLSWALGYNPRLQSSFYRSVDLGLAALVTPPGLLHWYAHLNLRPGVDTGSTAQSFGDSSTGFGWAIALGSRASLPFGLYLDGRWSFQHYALEYTLSEDRTVRARNEATDRYHTLSLGVGYRY